jgi:hypothetical protein
MLVRSVAFAFAFGLVASAGFSTQAQDFRGAQTPTHNIFCQASPPDQDNPAPMLRCDIQQQASRAPRPRGCRLSWGDSYVLRPTGPARLFCHGDTVRDDSVPVIAYGEQWRAYGFTCTSRRDGLTCVNGKGHGFFLSRASQRAF